MREVERDEGGKGEDGIRDRGQVVEGEREFAEVNKIGHVCGEDTNMVVREIEVVHVGCECEPGWKALSDDIKTEAIQKRKWKETRER